MTILVLGSSGKTGSAALRALADAGVHAVGLTRQRDARSDRIAALGHTVHVGDLRNPDDLRAHVRAAETVYFTLPFARDALAPARALTEVLKGEAPKSIVYLSQWLASEHHHAPMTRACWQAERMLGDSPHRALVVVEPGMFADNFLKGLYWAMSMRLFLHAIPGGRSAPVSDDDIGRAVCALLLSPHAYHGGRFRPQGPTLLDAGDMAAEVGAALGKRVLGRRVPFWLFEKSALALGVSEEELHNFRFYMREHASGAFSLSTGRDDDVFALTGRRAEPFSEIAKRYAREFDLRADARTRRRLQRILLTAPFLRSSRRPADPLPDGSGRWVQDCLDWKAGHAIFQRA